MSLVEGGYVSIREEKFRDVHVNRFSEVDSPDFVSCM